MKYTAEEYRAMATQREQTSEESFQRSDTDGFVTQWALDITAQEYREKAEIAENDGRAQFPALFTLEGELVPAKLVNTIYGRSWALLTSDNPNSPVREWFNPSKAMKPEVARRKDAQKGFYVGRVMARADARISSPPGARGLSGATQCFVEVYRTDGGFSRDVIVIDSGKE